MNLLELWKGIYREAIRLCDAIERLPEACPCGDAESHLSARCACCAGSPPRPGAAGGEDCTELLARLRADLLLFYNDLTRAGGSAQEGAAGELGHPVQRNILLAGADVERIIECLERVDEWVVGFRRTCAVVELKGIKRHGSALRAHCDRLNAELGLAG